MKLRRASYALSLALAGLLAFSGCQSLANRLQGVKTAITGQSATLTVEIVGVTVDAIMKDAAKAYHAGDLTALQWANLAAMHDRYRLVYAAEVKAIEAAHAPDQPSANLLSLLVDFKHYAETMKFAAVK